MFDSMFPSHWTTLRKLMWLKLKGASAVWSTITGNPVSFTAKAAPIRKLKVAFSPVQAGSGDPSPDNVRPISGWSSLTVEQRGKNLFNPADVISDTLIASGGKLLRSVGYSTIYIPLADNAQYTLSQTVVGNYARYALADDIAVQSTIYNPSTDSNSYVTTRPLTFTNQYHHKYLVATVYHTSDTVSLADVLGSIQLEFGNQATNYVPFNPSSRSISISLGQTVYSGWVDVISGLLRVTWAKSLLKDLTWSWYYKATGILKADPPKANGKANLLFTSFKYSGSVPYASLSNGEATGRDDDATIYVCNTEYATKNISDWLSSLTDDDYVVYELATPIPIQLTPQEVESLAGDNTMWSDSNGDLTVEYRSN